MNKMNPLTILTVGHSNHDSKKFALLLRAAGVTAIADVRTSPFSRHLSHFNRDVLREELRKNEIKYVFLGKELGGRPSGREFFEDGIADYEKMAKKVDFQTGLNRVIEGAKKYRIALMCAEQEPLDCHRCLLVGRALSERGVTVEHILPDGRIETQSRIEERLLELSGRQADDFFAPRGERLKMAYRDRAKKVAFSEPQTSTSESRAEKIN